MRQSGPGPDWVRIHWIVSLSFNVRPSESGRNAGLAMNEEPAKLGSAPYSLGRRLGLAVDVPRFPRIALKRGDRAMVTRR